MKNTIGFIPKKFEIQPDYYKNIFDNWNAVFIVDDGSVMGKEYHIEICDNYLEVLKVHSMGRTVIHYPSRFKTLKAAYTFLLKIIKPITNENLSIPYKQLRPPTNPGLL